MKNDGVLHEIANLEERQKDIRDSLQDYINVNKSLFLNGGW